MENLYLNAGQMKAGTTFLYQILENHEKIYFSLEKEVHYLSQLYGKYKLLSDHVRTRKAKEILARSLEGDKSPLSFKKDIEWINNYLEDPKKTGWYENIFNCAAEGQYVADFSNLTCTIPPAGLKEIKNRFSNVKITYCMRDPVVRAFSHMKFHLKFAGKNSQLENNKDDDLESLLLSDDIYPQGETLSHVDKLVKVFGKDNVRLIQCEDMWKDPQKTVSNICEFLDIGHMEIASNWNRPTNVGPKELMSERIEDLIVRSIRKEINGTSECKSKYSDIFIS